MHLYIVLSKLLTIKYKKIISLAFFILASAGVSVQAKSEATVNASSGLMLRKTAAVTKDNSISRIPYQEKVQVLARSKKQETIEGKTSSWVKVKWKEGTEGWVFGAFLSEPESLASSPSPSPTAKPSKAPEAVAIPSPTITSLPASASPSVQKLESANLDQQSSLEVVNPDEARELPAIAEPSGFPWFLWVGLASLALLGLAALFPFGSRVIAGWLKAKNSQTANQAGELEEECIGRGIKALTLQNYAEALQIFNQALEVNPRNGRAYFYRGCLRRGMSDLDGALSDLQSARIFFEASGDRTNQQETQRVIDQIREQV